MQVRAKFPFGYLSAAPEIQIQRKQFEKLIAIDYYEWEQIYVVGVVVDIIMERTNNRALGIVDLVYSGSTWLSLYTVFR